MAKSRKKLRDPPPDVRIRTIPKRSGGIRTIAVPSRALKARLRAMIPFLHERVDKVCDPNIVHGFAELRSPVTNARAHVGFKYSLSFDLEDFFDHVTTEKVGWGARQDPTDPFKECFYEGVAKQGLPTSPLIANLAAAEMDATIAGLLSTAGFADIRYTRYADDLTFSFNNRYQAGVIYEAVRMATVQCGFKVNEKKTVFQCASAGRRIITGVSVGETDVRPTRAAKRRLRAAKHNAARCHTKNWPVGPWTRHARIRHGKNLKPMPRRLWLQKYLNQKVKGLEEWCAMKLPKRGYKSGRHIKHQGPHEALAEIARRAIRRIKEERRASEPSAVREHDRADQDVPLLGPQEPPDSSADQAIHGS